MVGSSKHIPTRAKAGPVPWQTALHTTGLWHHFLLCGSFLAVLSVLSSWYLALCLPAHYITPGHHRRRTPAHPSQPQFFVLVVILNPCRQVPTASQGEQEKERVRGSEQRAQTQPWQWWSLLERWKERRADMCVPRSPPLSESAGTRCIADSTAWHTPRPNRPHRTGLVGLGHSTPCWLGSLWSNHRCAVWCAKD